MSHPLLILIPMTSAQLELINPDRSWKLDRRTVEVGRAGLAQARAALAAATPVVDIAPLGELPDVREDSSPQQPERSGKSRTSGSAGKTKRTATAGPRYTVQTLCDDPQFTHRAAA